MNYRSGGEFRVTSRWVIVPDKIAWVRDHSSLLFEFLKNRIIFKWINIP